MAIKINPILGATHKLYSFGSNAVLKSYDIGGGTPTSLVDKSGHGNDGVFTNITPAQLSSGLWYYTFNGTSSLIATSGAVIPTGDFSIAIWAYVSGGSAIRNMVTQWKTGSNTRFAFVITTASKLSLQWDGSTVLAADTVLSDSTWYFACATREGTDIKIYKDGVVDGTGTGGLGAEQDTVLRLGTYESGEWWNGRLALARVFPSALSAATILSMYSKEYQWIHGSGSSVKIS